MVEVFDVIDTFQPTQISFTTRSTNPTYVQFGMGVQNPMPVDKSVFNFYITTLKRLMPDAQHPTPNAPWCGLALGLGKSWLMTWLMNGQLPPAVTRELGLRITAYSPQNIGRIKRRAGCAYR